MPVNMDPQKRLRKKAQKKDEQDREEETEKAATGSPSGPKNLDEPTEADLAEKEWKHLWDATEVIDMDKW